MPTSPTERDDLSYLLWTQLTGDGWEGLDPSETLVLADAVLAAGWRRDGGSL